MPDDEEPGSWLKWQLTVLDIVLRVPPLFVLDALCSRVFTEPWLSQQWIECIGIIPAGVIYALLVIIAFGASVLIFTLTFESLFDIYRLLLAGAALTVSCTVSRQQIVDDSSTSKLNETSHDFLRHSSYASGTMIGIFMQISLAFLYDSLINHKVKTFLPQVWLRYFYFPPVHTYIFFLLPFAFQIFSSTSEIHKHHNFILVFFFSFASLEFSLDFTMTVSSIVKSFFRSCETVQIVANPIGLIEILIAHWQRIRVPTVFRLFWITRGALYFVFVDLASRNDVSVNDNDEETMLLWFQRQAVDVTVHGCDTMIALIGMSCIISYIAHYIGAIVMFLAGCPPDENREIGTMSAMLFFILALQSGLTDMDTAHRVTRVFRNFCLLADAMLHFIHISVDEHLLAISAGGLNTSITKHARALAVGLAMTIFATAACVVLWSHYAMGTWLFAITVFTAELFVKMTITLLVYALFMIDTRREDMWEELDDYVYLIRATGSCVEFIFGALLFGNGLCILFYESGSVLRASLMCVNLYFNIYKQARDGWSSLTKRRTALHKIDTLPEASAEEIRVYANVCAICYQELNSARLTKCRHMFHGVCLRKWLYTQDWCPLCQQTIYPVMDDTQEAATVECPAR